MQKPDYGYKYAFTLGALFIVIFGTYAALFLVDRQTSEALDRILAAFDSCHDSIQHQRFAESFPEAHENWQPVDKEAMDTAVKDFKRLSARLWMSRGKSHASVMDVAWNDWKQTVGSHPLPQYEITQLLHAIKLSKIQLVELKRNASDAFDLAIFLSGLMFSIGTAGSIAFYARLQQSRLKEELAAENLRKALASEDEIRKTIALELYDDIAQDVAAAKMLCERAQVSGAEVRSLVHRASLTLGEVNHKIRKLCTELHLPALEELGLHEAIRTLCDAESERQAKDLIFLPETGIPRLSRQVEGTLYRIIREAIMNAARHSKEGAVEIYSRIIKTRGLPKELEIEVRDRGYDESIQNRRRGHGLGLVAMKERAEQIGVDLFIKLDPKGSSVRIVLDLEKDNRKES